MDARAFSATILRDTGFCHMSITAKRKVVHVGHDGRKLTAEGRSIKARKSKKGAQLLTAAGTPAETPAENMLARNAQSFSKYVNYEALQRVYGDSMSPSLSRAASVAGSDSRPGSASGVATPAVTGDASAVTSPLRRNAGAPPTPAAAQQKAAAAVHSPARPPAHSPNMSLAPTPPHTQLQPAQAAVGADEGADEIEDELLDDESDIEDEDITEREPDEYDEYDERGGGGGGGGDDDYDDDYDAALDPLSHPSLEGTYE